MPHFKKDVNLVPEEMNVPLNNCGATSQSRAIAKEMTDEGKPRQDQSFGGLRRFEMADG
jgi:hypothetical protein